MKKNASGFILGVITLVLAAVGLIFMLVNRGNAYYSKYGTSTMAMGFAIAAVACALLYLLLNKNDVLGDLLVIATPVTAIVAFMYYLNDRVAGIASAMTFEASVAGASDGTVTCIVALAGLVLAAIFGIISAFKPAKK